MKPLLNYIVLSFLSLFFVLQIALLLLAVKPDIFISNTGDNYANSLSTNLSTPVNPAVDVNIDSALLPTQLNNQPVVSKVDTIGRSNTQAEANPHKTDDISQKLSDTVRAKDITNANENKAKAKLLETMNVENATRLIQQMETEEAKLVLKSMKKRQAAKILSSLEPEKAIELIR